MSGTLGLDAPEESGLRENCVASGDGQCFTDYQVGRLNLPDHNTSSAIIAVSPVEGAVLVAVPSHAWAAKRKDRALPGGSLKKATAVEVVSCTQGDRDTPSAEPDLKVWVGLLDPKLENAVIYGDIGADIEFPGKGDLQQVPFAPGLVALCNDIFAFITAESQAHKEEHAPGEVGGAEHLESRMLAMEAMLQEVFAHLPQASTTAPRAPGLLRARAKPAPAPDAGLPGNIDPAVAQQALQAGISAEALQDMSRIVGDRGSTRAPKTAPPVAVVQESEDSEMEEEAAVAAAAELGSTDPMQTAVLQLTRLVTRLGKEKARKKDKSLEAMLDGAEGAGSVQEPGSKARSRAAALRALHLAVKTDPKAIYGALEQRLAEDWEEEGMMPGIAQGRVSARGWLEHRSRIGHFPSTIRSAWTVCGVWDLLRAGRTDEARARVGLAVAALDQQAIDRGSYLLAAEVQLERPPPYAAFVGHQPPDQWELQQSRLLDPRWVELMMGKLRDLADFQEKRVRLTSAKRYEDPAAGKGDKPDKAGKGQKGKGSGKNKDAVTPAPAGAQSS